MSPWGSRGHLGGSLGVLSGRWCDPTRFPGTPLETSGAPRHNLMDRAVDIEIIEKPLLFILFPRFGLPRDVSGRLKRSPWTQQRSLGRQPGRPRGSLGRQSELLRAPCVPGRSAGSPRESPRAPKRSQGPRERDRGGLVPPAPARRRYPKPKKPGTRIFFFCLHVVALVTDEG